jgi:uncharacterized repeat protein (TIGR01451 family)
MVPASSKAVGINSFQAEALQVWFDDPSYTFSNQITDSTHSYRITVSLLNDGAAGPVGGQYADACFWTDTGWQSHGLGPNIQFEDGALPDSGCESYHSDHIYVFYKNGTGNKFGFRYVNLTGLFSDHPGIFRVLIEDTATLSPAPILQLSIDGPASLSVVNGQYSPNPFDITATVSNSGNATATNVHASITLPDELNFTSLTPTITYNIGSLAPGQQQQVSWNVKVQLGAPLDQARQTSYSVTATADNADSRFAENQLLIPVIGTANTECGIPTCIDTDRDGIWNNWESQGGGIDVNNDGHIDLDLYVLGARPNRKDVFVEIDYMPGKKPEDVALADVRKAFDIAPVCNEDEGGHCPAGIASGIALHTLVDEELPAQDAILFDTSSVSIDLHNDFNDFKWGSDNPYPGNHDILCGVKSSDAHFGSISDRVNSNCQNILEAKRRVFRYAIFGKELVATGADQHPSGQAELGGNDLFIALGDSWLQTVDQLIPGHLKELQEATFMHELGHTLGLTHGGVRDQGDEEYNCKPNYFSIMNYLYQFRSFDPTRPLDYSPKAAHTLSETNLIESEGVGGPKDRKVLFDPYPYSPIDPRRLFVPSFDAAGPMDWNGDGDTIDTGISRDINNITVYGLFVNFYCLRPSPGQTLMSNDDWANLDFNFRDNPNAYADGATRSNVPREITAREVEEALKTTDYDGDGVANAYDIEPATPNSFTYVPITIIKR